MDGRGGKLKTKVGNRADSALGKKYFEVIAVSFYVLTQHLVQ